MRYIDCDTYSNALNYYHRAIRLGWSCSRPFRATTGWSVCTNRP